MSGRLDLNQRPLDPQSNADGAQAPENASLPTNGARACTNACTSDGENGPIRADRLEVIADLLADLAEAERQEVIAQLAPADRVTIARLLIGRRDSRRKQ